MSTTKVQPGDVFFSMDDTLVSKAIRLVSTGRSDMIVPSHVGVIDEVTSDSIYVVEAIWAGVLRRDVLKVYLNHCLWFARVGSPKNVAKGLAYVNSKLGKRYDYTALISILFRAFLRCLGPTIYNKVRLLRNFLQSKRRFYCSELTAKTIKEMGKTPWHGPDSEVTPYDLYRSKQMVVYETIDLRKGGSHEPSIRHRPIQIPV